MQVSGAVAYHHCSHHINIGTGLLQVLQVSDCDPLLGSEGIPDYPDAFAGWNMVSSIGAYITMFSVVLFFFIVYRTFTAGEKAAANPWGVGATTLEWTVASSFSW